MNIANLTHPEYETHLTEWLKWRLTYESGKRFINHYLRRLGKRETREDFDDRLAVTYCPAFAKSGINEIRDSIYQRMTDITRAGGSQSYQSAIAGLDGGVDLDGSSMNYFMGCKVLPELLTMRKVGIFVDMPPLQGVSLADNRGIRPYVYMYCPEDIRCWDYDACPIPNDFDAILLREEIYVYDEDTGFPYNRTSRYRRVWRDQDGLIWACFYDAAGNMVDADGSPTPQPTQLNISRIPFVEVSISESLLTDIADYQISLLNLASTDMSYALKSNYPFYTEQNDVRTQSPHLKPTGDTSGEAKTEEINVGVTRGRRYPKGLERPGFIHPSSEPLTASMAKQEQLKAEIRLLLRLTVANLRGPKMASAESKQEDSATLETGLSYIGLALEMAERKVSELWAMYEGTKQIPTITYPESYSLRSDEERRAEATDLQGMMNIIPSMLFQKAIGKRIARIVLGPRVSREDLNAIDNQIDAAPTMSSDPTAINLDLQSGLVSLDLASKIRGYPSGEVEKAKADHAERLARIAASQAEANAADNPAARGNPDAASNPGQDARDEKTASRDTTVDDVPTDKTRGGGK